MHVNYDSEKLKNVLTDFYNATGVNIQLLKKNFSAVEWRQTMPNSYCKTIQSSDGGRIACIKSDRALLEKCKESKKTEIHICHAGLVDAAVPILFDDNIIGYIILGQMRTETPYNDIKLPQCITDCGNMENHYKGLSYFDKDKIHSIANIATMLTKHILTENMLKPSLNKNIEKAIEYIDENFDKDLTVKNISKSINISKSVIYKNFHANFNCTVNQYINHVRVDKSVKLLMNSDLSMEEISRKVGFSSGAYYSKIFKKIKGISPLKFRKQNGEV